MSRPDIPNTGSRLAEVVGLLREATQGCYRAEDALVNELGGRVPERRIRQMDSVVATISHLIVEVQQMRQDWQSSLMVQEEEA